MTVEECLNEDMVWDVFASKYPNTAIAVEKAMIEFAEYHVRQALKAADGEAPLHCSEGIKNCYSKENIR